MPASSSRRSCSEEPSKARQAAVSATVVSTWGWGNGANQSSSLALAT